MEISPASPSAGKHYSDVLHQQGRVWLDSDWNEQVFDRLDLLEQETIDVIGRCGVPDDPGTAFLIEPKPNDATDFIIHGGAESAGRAYVDGILCASTPTRPTLTQPDFLDPPPIALPAQNDARAIIYLEVWRRLITTWKTATSARSRSTARTPPPGCGRSPRSRCRWFPIQTPTMTTR